MPSGVARLVLPASLWSRSGWPLPCCACKNAEPTDFRFETGVPCSVPVSYSYAEKTKVNKAKK